MNNTVENEAVILGLHKLRALSIKSCIVNDSRIIVSQIEKDCAA
jgi:ribonuclease HI